MGFDVNISDAGNDFVFSNSRPTGPRQLELIKTIMQELQYSVGDMVHVISMKWAKQWLEYCDCAAIGHYDRDDAMIEGNGLAISSNSLLESSLKAVPPIFNHDLLDLTFEKGPLGEFVFKDYIREDVEYGLIPSKVWHLLIQWYGLDVQSASIGRKILKLTDGMWVVNVHHANFFYFFTNAALESLPTLNCIENSDGSWKFGVKYQCSFPDSVTVQCVKQSVAKNLLYFANKIEISVDGLVLIDDAFLFDWKGMVLEIKLFSEPCGSITVFDKGGVIGLQNLGNTCYMNSAVQCLSNCEQLARYFLSGKFASEINSKNPIGSGGAIAKVYASLAREMWLANGDSNNYDVENANIIPIAPLKLKNVFSKFEPRFEGFRQHDSQEFTSALLDRIHEDLNRVIHKPYIELSDSNGRSDELISAEYWSIYKARNDSIIVDSFQGQFRSLVECLKCGKVSAAFDPFSFVSIPIPTDDRLDFKIILLDAFNSQAVEIHLDDRNGFVSDVIFQVCQKIGGNCSESDFVAAEVFDGSIYRTFSPYYPIQKFINSLQYNFIYKKARGTNGECWVLFRDIKSRALIGHPLLLSFLSTEDLEKVLKEKTDCTIEIVKEDTEGNTVFNVFIEENKLLTLLNAEPLDRQAIGKTVDIFDCLDLFTAKESLTVDDPWYCSNCKDHCPAVKQMTFWSLPSNLIIHLKRFSFSRRLFGEKISSPISFPLKCLDLSKYVSCVGDEDYIYDLFAISEQYGSLSGGHYTASCQNWNNQKWYHFDDGQVHDIDPESLNSTSTHSAAYMLFYKRRGK